MWIRDGVALIGLKFEIKIDNFEWWWKRKKQKKSSKQNKIIRKLRYIFGIGDEFLLEFENPNENLFGLVTGFFLLHDPV